MFCCHVRWARVVLSMGQAATVAAKFVDATDGGRRLTLKDVQERVGPGWACCISIPSGGQKTAHTSPPDMRDRLALLQAHDAWPVWLSCFLYIKKMLLVYTTITAATFADAAIATAAPNTIAPKTMTTDVLVFLFHCCGFGQI